MRIGISSAVAIAIMLSPALAFAQDQATSPSRNAALPAQSQQGQLSSQDQNFLKQAAARNIGEIRIAVLAETKAKSPSVIAFSRLMADDHTAMAASLGHVAMQENVQLPSSPPQKDDQLQSELESQSPGTFDAQFMRHQVQDHQQDVQEFTREQQATNNPAMRALLAQSLPILRQHLQLAQAVEAAQQNENTAQLPGQPSQPNER